jgi:flagellar M-ring protein FliF
MRRWNAKQKELALIISRMRGIESATVQYDEEAKGGLTRQKHKTAMVAVQTIAGALDPDQLRAIRNVVASAYAGLDRQSITITDMTSGLSYGGAIGPGGVPDDESLYASHKQKFERDWQRKITDQLSMIPGVVVGVNVELTPQIAGRPGAQANGVGNQPVSIAAAAGSGGSNLTETRNEAINLPGYAVESIGKSPLTPTMVTASIELPASYFLQVWRQRNPPAAGSEPKPPDPAELAKVETETVNRIKETVRNLLPPVNQGTNPYPHIVVSTYTDLPTSAAVVPTLASETTSWLAENWQTLAVVGIGLVSLLMLRSMVRSPALPASPQRSAAVATAEHPGPRLAKSEAEESPAEAEPVQTLRRRFKATAGPDLKVELQEIVKENPDAAANILRSWIGDAA